MTASVNILRGDLHLAVSTAFNRGRYVLMTGGDGQPQEITIDLRERPDDLFEQEPQDWVETSSPGRLNAAPRREDIGKWRPFSTDAPRPEPQHPDVSTAVYEAMRRVHGETGRRALVWQALGMYGAETGALPGSNVLDHFSYCMARDHEHAIISDDHGPAIPAQDVGRSTFPNIETEAEPRVYEFALQDAVNFPADWTLAHAGLHHAADIDAANAADWVHVYDRVTRERRTLKRPEPDAVLTGLRDVAADLRGRNPSMAIVDEIGLRGAPVEPPFGCAPLPPVGPLTSVDGVRVGDVVRAAGGVGFVRSVYTSDGSLSYERGGKTFATGYGEEISFVGRPDADGWMVHSGTENPVPGVVAQYRFADGFETEGAKSDAMEWRPQSDPPAGGDIVAFRIVDSPPAV